MDPTDPRPAAEPASDTAEPVTDGLAADATDGSAADAPGEGHPSSLEHPEPVAPPEAVAPPSYPAATGFTARHPVLVYTLLRLAILAAVGGVLYLLGARGLILLVFAFLLSGLISMVALARPREGAAYGITSTVRKVNERIDAAARAEDDDDIDEVMDDVAPEQRRPDQPPTP